MPARLQSRGLEALLAVLLAGFAAGPGLAQGADCGVALTLDRTPPNFLYDPFDALPPVERVDFTVKAAEPAEVLVTFETEAGIPLPVEVPGSGVTLSINAAQVGQWSAASPGSLVLNVAAEQAQTVSVDFLLDNTVVAPPGTYRERVFTRVQNRSNGLVCSNRPAFETVVDVPPRAQMNIAGADGGFDRSLRIATVDFGSLAEGVSRQVFLQLRTNSPVQLRIESQNRGALVLQDASEPLGRVPYSATLGSSPVMLEGGWSTSLPAAATFAGRSLPLIFRIGSVPPVPSGHYSDILTITVTAL